MNNFSKIKVGDLIAFKSFRGLLPTGISVGQIIFVVHKSQDPDLNNDGFISGAMSCLTNDLRLIFFNVYTHDQFEIISKFANSQ